MTSKMRTPLMPMTSFSTSYMSSNLHLKISSSEQPSPWLSSTWLLVRSSGFRMTCFTMSFGIISNLHISGHQKNHFCH